MALQSGIALAEATCIDAFSTTDYTYILWWCKINSDYCGEYNDYDNDNNSYYKDN